MEFLWCENNNFLVILPFTEYEGMLLVELYKYTQVYTINVVVWLNMHAFWLQYNYKNRNGSNCSLYGKW